ncbi:DNA polymerase IV, partial [Bacteroidota bacterium]
TVSKIATGEAKPNGLLQVPKDQIQPFLYPLSIRKIPMLGNKAYKLLRSMGLSTIRTLSEVPPEMMEKVMGKNGIVIWKKANGIDSTPVAQYSEMKSIGTERTFDKDTIDIIRLNEILIGMVEKNCFRLRKKQYLTSCVTVKIRYSNFDTHTLQRRIPYTSFDHELLEISKELFKQLYSRRMLIRLIGVKFSHLVHGTQQLNLFEDTPEMTSLYQAMDRMRLRYGKSAVKRAVAL